MTRLLRSIREKARDVSKPPILIAALGDSITQGVMEHSILDSEGTFHRLLQNELEAFFPTTTFSTINAGVSGGSATSALERLQRDVLRYSPDLVIVSFGLNDALLGEAGLTQFEAALRKIVHKIEEDTSAEIILVTPPFAAKKKSFRIHPDHLPMADAILNMQNAGSLGRYADVIRRVGWDSNVCLVDVHQEWLRLAEDGLDTDVLLINGLNHPDRRGNKITALLLFNAIVSEREWGLPPSIGELIL